MGELKAVKKWFIAPLVAISAHNASLIGSALIRADQVIAQVIRVDRNDANASGNALRSSIGYRLLPPLQLALSAALHGFAQPIAASFW